MELGLALSRKIRHRATDVFLSRFAEQSQAAQGQGSRDSRRREAPGAKSKPKPKAQGSKPSVGPKMARLMRESGHTMVPEGATGRYQCSVCRSVVSINSHGSKPTQQFLQTACVPAQPWTGVQGAFAVQNVFIGASFVHATHQMVVFHRGMFLCVSCGSHATRSSQNLLKECQPCTTTGRNFLDKKFMKGLV